MASEAARKAELQGKLRALGARRGLTPEQLFRAYDGDGDGALRRDELVRLLADAGIGSGLTRGAWASGLLRRLDRDQGGALTWDEVQAALGAPVVEETPQRPQEPRTARPPPSDVRAAREAPSLLLAAALGVLGALALRLAR